MTARRARIGGSIARIAVIGALVVTVAFGAIELDSIVAQSRSSDPHHTRIAARETKSTVVSAGSTRSRGHAWVASLVTAAACAALTGHLLGARRRATARRNLPRFSIRLRAPPRLHVTH